SRAQVTGTDLLIPTYKNSPAIIKIGVAPKFKFRVMNQGMLSSTATAVRLRIDDGVGPTVNYPVVSLPSLDSVELKAEPNWVATPGKHKYELCVDPDNLASDVDASNNCVYREFVVADASEQAPPPGVDLFVSSVKIAPPLDKALAKSAPVSVALKAR